jgi:Ca-activated chloride channel family protein
MADINLPDYELRTAIIKNKASALGITIPNDVLSLLAEKLHSNIRQLEGVVRKIAAQKFLTDAPITKEVAANFVNSRKNDNIGLTIFAGESFTQCPLTIDHAAVLNMLNAVQCEIALKGIIEDGTAIGMGIANGVSRLKDSKAVSKVIILLTDGSNNSGEISPEAAAEIAKEYGVRVYAIGVGTNNPTAPYPYGGEVINVPVEIDEDVLQQIAKMTGGSYFRATDNASLGAIYGEIDQMEKTKLQVREYKKRNEEFFPYLLTAFLLLVIEILIRNTILRRLP